MQNKTFTISVLSVILILLIGFGTFIYVKNNETGGGTGGTSVVPQTLPANSLLVEQQTRPGAQEQLCPTTSSPTAIYPNRPVNYCYIGGNLNCDAKSDIDRVAFRHTGTYDAAIYVDYQSDGRLAQFDIYDYSYSRSKSTNDIVLPFTTPEGYEIRKVEYASYIYLYVYYDASSPTRCHWYRRQKTNLAFLDDAPLFNCITKEKCVPKQKYACKVKLCSTSVPGYTNCEFQRVENAAWNVIIDPLNNGIELQTGQQATFRPQYVGTGIAMETSKFTLRADFYDSSCSSPKEQGGSCDIAIDKYCIEACPTGYTLRTSSAVYCYGTFRGQSYYSHDARTNPICKKTGVLDTYSGSTAICVEPTNPQQNKFYPCVAVAGACNSKSTVASSCQTGQVCKPVSGNVGDAGWGGCICLNQANCGEGIFLNDRIMSGTIGTEYKMCCASGTVTTDSSSGMAICSGTTGCPTLSPVMTCPSSGSYHLYFNQLTGTCECPNSIQEPSKCDSQNAVRCSNLLSSEKCNPVTIGSKTCYFWQLEDTCTSKEQCENGYCKCLNTDCNSLTQKKCDNNMLYNCVRYDDCFGWSNTGTQKSSCCLDDSGCLTGYICANNNCELQVDWCATTADCQTTNPLKICGTNNKCVYPTNTCVGSVCFCDAVKATTGAKQCNGETLEVCRQPEIGKYLWTAEATKTDCCISATDCGTGKTCNLATNNCDTIPCYCQGDLDCTGGKICVLNGCKWPTNTGAYCDVTKKNNNVKRCNGNTLELCSVQSGDTCDAYKYIWSSIGSKTKCCISSSDCGVGQQCNLNSNECEVIPCYCLDTSSCTTPGQICQSSSCKWPTNTGVYCDSGKASANVKRCNGNILEQCISSTGNSCDPLKYIWNNLGTKTICCLVDSNCNDGNPGTTDSCSNYECKFNPITNYCGPAQACTNPEHQCISNVCQYPPDGTCVNNICYCSETKAAIGATQCKNMPYPSADYIELCVSKGSGKFIWEAQPACSADEYCAIVGQEVQMMSGETPNSAACRPDYDLMGILTRKVEFGINEEIGDVTIDVTSNYAAQHGSKANQPVLLFLYDGASDLSSGGWPGTTGSDGKSLYTVTYKPQKTGTLMFKAVVNPYDAVKKFETTKTIYVKKSIEVQLTCDTNIYVYTPIQCIYHLYDADSCKTGLCVDVTGATPTIKVTEGTKVLDYSYVPGKANTFQFTPTSETVVVEVNGATDAALGYIPGVATLTLYPQTAGVSIKLYIDGNEVSTLGNGITSGSHLLKLVYTKGGQPLKMSRVDFTYNHPQTNEPVNVDFKEQSVGVHTTTHNFDLEGQTYRFTIGGLAQDYTIQIPGYNPSVVVTKTIGGCDTMCMVKIIGISVGVLIVLIVVVVLVIRRRRA